MSLKYFILKNAILKLNHNSYLNNNDLKESMWELFKSIEIFFFLSTMEYCRIMCATDNYALQYQNENRTLKHWL